LNTVPDDWHRNEPRPHVHRGGRAHRRRAAARVVAGRDVRAQRRSRVARAHRGGRARRGRSRGGTGRARSIRAARRLATAPVGRTRRRSVVRAGVQRRTRARRRQAERAAHAAGRGLSREHAAQRRARRAPRGRPGSSAGASDVGTRRVRQDRPRAGSAHPRPARARRRQAIPRAHHWDARLGRAGDHHADRSNAAPLARRSVRGARRGTARALDRDRRRARRREPRGRAHLHGQAAPDSHSPRVRRPPSGRRSLVPGGRGGARGRCSGRPRVSVARVADRVFAPSRRARALVRRRTSALAQRGVAVELTTQQRCALGANAAPSLSARPARRSAPRRGARAACRAPRAPARREQLLVRPLRCESAPRTAGVRRAAKDLRRDTAGEKHPAQRESRAAPCCSPLARTPRRRPRASRRTAPASPASPSREITALGSSPRISSIDTSVARAVARAGERAIDVEQAGPGQDAARTTRGRRGSRRARAGPRSVARRSARSPRVPPRLRARRWRPEVRAHRVRLAEPRPCAEHGDRRALIGRRPRASARYSPSRKQRDAHGLRCKIVDESRARELRSLAATERSSTCGHGRLVVRHTPSRTGPAIAKHARGRGARRSLSATNRATTDSKPVELAARVGALVRRAGQTRRWRGGSAGAADVAGDDDHRCLLSRATRSMHSATSAVQPVW
jgi:hypothetical protein